MKNVEKRRKNVEKRKKKVFEEMMRNAAAPILTKRAKHRKTSKNGEKTLKNVEKRCSKNVEKH